MRRPRAKAVKVWTWRRMLRDHGPHAQLLTLYTISTYMDTDGYCYPSQQRIAQGARVSVRTVQRHIRHAVNLGWLHVETDNAGGLGWRRNVYRAAVPIALELCDEDEEQRDNLLKSCADIEGDDTQMSPPSDRRTRVTTKQARVTTPGAQGDDTGRHRVTTPGWRNNSSVNSSKNSSTKGAALRAAPTDKKSDFRKKTNQPIHVSEVLPTDWLEKRDEALKKVGLKATQTGESE